MEIKEIEKIIQDTVGASLSKEALGAIIDEKLKGYLKPLGTKDVIIGAAPEDKQPKCTFSQFLGDVRRLSANPAAPPEQVMKFLKKDQLIRADSNVNLEHLNPVLRDLYGSTTHGGYLVPTEESRELINIAAETFSVVPGLCRRVPMRTHQITFPTLTSGLTAYWIPEAGSTTTLGVTPDGTHQATGEKIRSNLAVGQMTLNAYVCAVLVVVSNQLLDDSDPAIDTILRQLFAETLGDAWDTACLRGTGAALDPISGLDTLIATNALAAGAVFDYDDIVDLIFACLEHDSKCYPSIVGHIKAEKMLMKVKDNNAQYIYKKPSEALGIPEVWGHPYRRDGNVSTVLGAGANETKLYAGDFGRHGYAGTRMGLIIKTNPYGEPYFSFNQTAFLAEFRVGFQVDSEAFFASLSGVPTA